MNKNNQIVVWDLFVRVFHWSLVLFFIVAYATGDEKHLLHRYVGYGVLGLVVARIFWGFVGTKHARFSDFICSPVKGLNYLKGLAARKPTYHTGHNPAAAWMILFLLIGSLFVCLSGYAAYVTKEQKPILSFGTDISFIENAYADNDEKEHHAASHHKEEKDDAEDDGIWGDIHEISAQCMVFLIFVHISGVTVSSILHNENLIRAMFTGKKTQHESR
jgi:cytochrome b